MVTIKLFSNDHSLKTEFSKENQSYIVITPSPSHADTARALFGDASMFDVQTISNFIKDEFEALFEQEVLSQKKNKSGLALILGAAWKSAGLGSNYELFKKCFDILTDLRSYTLNKDILESLLEKFDDDISQIVMTFSHILEALDIIDEHKSYYDLSQRYRHEDLPPLYKTEKNIIFWGFDFLSPMQIDFITSLSIRNNIFIPLDENVQKKATDFDWISWLTKFGSTISKIESSEKVLSKKDIIYFNKNELSSCIKNYKSSYESLVVCSKNPSFEMIKELASKNLSYKYPTNILQSDFNELKDYWISLIKTKNILSLEEFDFELNQIMQNSIEGKNYRRLKVYQLFKQILNDWKELSDANTNIDEFDIRLFLDSLALDLPRNYYVNINDTQGVRALSLKDIDDINENEKVLFCLTSNHGPIRSNLVEYSSEVQSLLATIGPVRRSDFEFEIFKSRLIRKIESSNATFMVEKGLLDHDLYWKKVFDEIDLNILDEKKDITHAKSHIINVEANNQNIKNYSASRLQTYIDCPRKYWVRYIQKYSPNVSINGKLSALQIGLVEHDVLEKYLSSFNEYDEKEHVNLIKSSLHKYKLENDIEYSLSFLEVKNFTFSTILELLELKREYGLNFTFEKDISSNIVSHIGSIDCFGTGNVNVLFDFKRGASSIPSKKALLEFSKIQVLLYLLNTKKTAPSFFEKEFLTGFINLSELESSLIISNSKDLAKSLKQTGLKLFSKIQVIENFDEVLEDYEAFETQKVLDMNNDNLFLPTPSSDQICTFCDIKNVCVRSYGN
ncbi:MAG: PD-(D/E)XK nuclease family protein [Bacteriovoracaceae bacterium]|jgi:hypothetical protein|nr:PD-(D/E)XK nuclease family protein [Bacteriovoracaceae bacterium]